MTNPEPGGNGVNLNKPDPSNELRIDPPHTHPHPPHEVPGWVSEATRPAQPQPQFQTQSQTQAQPQPQPTFSNTPPSSQTVSGTPWNLAQTDASSRKLVAGLLAIFLGSLGAHKFYLGRTTPGLIMLLVNVGGWFVTGILSIITLGIGAIVLIPLMLLVMTVLCVVGLIEGVVYLTRSDEEFTQTYLIGKKDWF